MVRSKTLNNILNQKPTNPLYHYTSPTGLIGILKNKELWATNAIFQNDRKEQRYAAEIASNAAYNIMNHLNSEMEKKLLQEMMDKAGSAGPRIYIASFSEEKNLLSQWRAYCSDGGYSIGIPPKQIIEMTKAQDFYLAKCVYDQREQQKIVQEIIYSFIDTFRKRKDEGLEESKNYQQTTGEFYQYLGQFGAVIKNHQFSEEKEWRIISKMIPEDHPQIEFRAGNGIVIPYYKFELTNNKHPNLMDVDGEKLEVMAGPSNYEDQISSTAAQFVMQKYLGQVKFSVSNIPYRLSH